MTNCCIHQGSAADVLATLPRKSVHCLVTSPPYFHLRDYQADGQIGLERTPEQYIRRLVEVFRAAREVLRDDGSMWINIGDSYARDGVPSGLPKKSLLLIPFRLAAALQEDGWILRCDVVWEKSNCTPESAHDRPCRSHEYLFLFSKQARYYYDREEVREVHQGKPPTGKKAAALARAGLGVIRPDGTRAERNGLPVYSANTDDGKWAKSKEAHGGFVTWNPRGRNRRSVWHLPASCFDPKTVGIHDVDHFAMFPPRLIEPCVLASTPSGGCCPHCLTPLKRYVASYEDLEDTWVPQCSCPPGEPVPATVLDPFCGSGTTGVVAKRHGRNFTGVELNPSYVRLAQARIGSANLK